MMAEQVRVWRSFRADGQDHASSDMRARRKSTRLGGFCGRFSVGLMLIDAALSPLLLQTHDIIVQLEW